MAATLGVLSRRRKERLAPIGDALADRQKERHRIHRREILAFGVFLVSGFRGDGVLAHRRALRDAARFFQVVLGHAEMADDAFERLMERRQGLIRALTARILRGANVDQFGLQSCAHGARLKVRGLAENVRRRAPDGSFRRLRRRRSRVLKPRKKIVDRRLEASERAVACVEPLETLRQGADLSFERLKRFVIRRLANRPIHALRERLDENRKFALSFGDAGAIFDLLRERRLHPVQSLGDFVQGRTLSRNSRGGEWIIESVDLERKLRELALDGLQIEALGAGVERCVDFSVQTAHQILKGGQMLGVSRASAAFRLRGDRLAKLIDALRKLREVLLGLLFGENGFDARERLRRRAFGDVGLEMVEPTADLLERRGVIVALQRPVDLLGERCDERFQRRHIRGAAIDALRQRPAEFVDALADFIEPRRRRLCGDDVKFARQPLQAFVEGLDPLAGFCCDNGADRLDHLAEIRAGRAT